MWARSRMPGLEARQIATSNIVGHGCKCCIKVDLVFEFPAFTAHHIRDALRCTLAQHPYGSPEWNQEVKLLIGRRCSQVLYKLRSQWRECFDGSSDPPGRRSEFRPLRKRARARRRSERRRRCPTAAARAGSVRSASRSRSDPRYSTRKRSSGQPVRTSDHEATQYRFADRRSRSGEPGLERRRGGSARGPEPELRAWVR